MTHDHPALLRATLCSILLSMAQPANLSYASASILLAVDSGFRYGFDIMDCTGLPSGTVYPALRRLEASNLVTAEWENTASLNRLRPARKYYSITRLGGKALAAALKRYPLMEHILDGLRQDDESRQQSRE